MSASTARDARRLHLDVRLDADGPVVFVQGELDVHTAGQLRRAMTDLVHAGSREMVLDLRELTFIDSAGLGVLVGGLKRARERGGDVALASPPTSVARVLEMTGLSTVFRVLPEAAPEPG